MKPGIVERLYAEFTDLTRVLEHACEPSLQVTADDCFRKALLMSAASQFESSITGTILDLVTQASVGNALVVEFLRNKAISRQYHTLFDWDATNANRFFGLFGDDFKKTMAARLKTDADLAEGVKAFLELGRERNRLTHENFGAFALEKTAQEIFDLFLVAARFPTALPLLLGLPTGTADSNQPATEPAS